jgi:hypothetical protein
MPCRIQPSSLSGILAETLGRIEAEVRGRLDEELQRILSKFSNQCPPKVELEQSIAKLNRLIAVVNNFQGRIAPFERMVKRLDPPLNTAKKLVTVLKSISIPTTVGAPPPYGGVIFSVPIKITNKYSELLRLACELVVSIEDDIKACKSLLETTSLSFSGPSVPSLGVPPGVLNTINQILALIEGCAQEAGLSQDELRKLRDAADLGGTGVAGSVDSEVPFRSTNGKDYTLSVQTDPNSPSIAPRRFAVAKDQIGVIVLRGPSSFASSTDVLIKELKFRIDNQLP